MTPITRVKEGARTVWPVLGPILAVVVIALVGAVATNMQGQINAATTERDAIARTTNGIDKRLERVCAKLENVEADVQEIKASQKEMSGQVNEIHVMLRGMGARP